MAYGDNLTTYTGEEAFLYFKPYGGSGYDMAGIGVGDFTITLERGTVEQELLGQTGNYFTQGSLTVNGSLTSVKLGSNAAGIFLDSMLNTKVIQISGGVNNISGLTFDFASGQITGFDISMGDASTITEASVDFTILNPYQLTKTATANGTKHLSC